MFNSAQQLRVRTELVSMAPVVGVRDGVVRPSLITPEDLMWQSLL